MWESNPPKRALTRSLTVLKTAPITGQDAPPREKRVIKAKRFGEILSSFYAQFLKLFQLEACLTVKIERDILSILKCERFFAL